MIKEVSADAHKIENVGHSINSTFTARVYGLGRSSSGRESYAYSAGSRVDHSADILLNGIYSDTLKVCDNDPVRLDGVIRYDYTDVDWILMDSTGTSDPSIITYNNTPNVPEFSFPHVEEYAPKDWTVNMIVTRTTPLCAHNIQDTITATVRVYPTQFNDSTWDANGEPKVFCYGDDISIKYSEDGDKNHVVEHHFMADTITPAAINKDPYGTIVFELDSVYTILDSLKNEFGCDSVVERKFIIRATYDTLVYDTICYQHLPYEWRNEETGR